MDLTKLRYLNVRANYLTSIPSVVCSLPCLEILDISRNKIRKLPAEPGRLVELRVLSISNNRLKKLPVWLAKARHLRILKIESNPIVWPPPHISTMPPFEKATVAGGEINSGSQCDPGNESTAVVRKKAEDRHMTVWISKLKQWLEENKGQLHVQENEKVEPAYEKKAEKPVDKAHEQAKDESENVSVTQEPQELNQQSFESSSNIGATFLNDTGDDGSEGEDTEKDASVLTLPVTQDDSDHIPHVPVMGSHQESSQPEGSQLDGQTNDALTQESMEQEPLRSASQASLEQRPPAFDQPAAVAPPFDKRAKPTRVSWSSDVEKKERHSVDMASASAKDVTGLLDTNMEKDHDGLPGAAFGAESLSRTGSHNRNNSHTLAKPSTPQQSTRKGLMKAKKSLPDLRQNHETIIMDRQDQVAIAADDIPLLRSRRPSNSSVRRPPLPQLLSDPGARLNGEDLYRRRLNTGFQQETLQGAGVRRPSNVADTASTSSSTKAISTAATTSAAAVESERNSYFKRLSTLPESTISKSISVPVLRCIDGTRSVLYALSQVHGALKHYVTFATDERMTSQLSRILDIAGASMASLIQSLDRFDSLSRSKGGILDPTVVRGVLTSCVESIATFRKVMHVVQLQLKSLQGRADIRYSRTLLVLLYGSLGEIATSWTTIESSLGDVAPYLAGSVQPHISSISTPGLPSIAESTSPLSPSSSRGTMPPSRPQRRRHAGSFSAKDIAQGATMNSGTPLAFSNGSEDARKTHRPPNLSSVSEPKLTQYQAVQGSATPSSSHISRPLEHHQVSDSRHRSTFSADGKQAVASATSLHGNLHYGQGDNEVLPIDDHLLLLVVKITSVAYGVWAGIEEHLISYGLPTATSSIMTKQPSDSNGDASFSPKTPNRVPKAFGRNASETSFRRNASDASVTMDTPVDYERRPSEGSEGAASRPDETAVHHAMLSPAAQRRFRRLYDLTRGVNEHTHRLQACLERAQDASIMPSLLSPHATETDNSLHEGQQQHQNAHLNNIKASASRDLVTESGHFVKSILHISHFIKGLASEGFVLPKYVKASLAELTTCARDLTLHLHFLSGPTVTHAPLAGYGHPNASAASAPAHVSHQTLWHQQQQMPAVPPTPSSMA